jgi:hypothetical protein
MMIGRIYKIVAGQGHECYIGSTIQELRYRFRHHKLRYKKWKNEATGGCSVFQLFDQYGVENCHILLIKQYEVVDRNHLEVYENLWIKKMKSINKKEPCGGLLLKQQKKQRYEANAERIKEQMKQYYEVNAERIKEKKKQYREANAESITEKNKQYYEANKEQIKEQKKQYYETNAERIKEKKKQYYETNAESITEKNKQYREAKKKNQLS